MAQKFVKVLGIIFLILGVVGFILPMPDIFHLTPVHNIVHLVSGVVALVMARTVSGAILFAKIFGVVYLLVGILGLFVDTFIGIHFLPADNILHFVIAFASLYVGFAAPKTNHTHV